MILNTGQRTDIPAFYTPWFIKRLKEGFADVRNPFYPKLVTRFSLDPKVVDVLCFCSKNPTPLFPYLDEIVKKYRTYFMMTLTPYGKDVEPCVPYKRTLIKTFQKLSSYVGKEATVLRYDPIFLTERYTEAYHIHAFNEICSGLEGYTSTIVISFLDLYEKTKKNFKEGRALSYEEEYSLVSKMVPIATKHNLKIRLCLEDKRLGVLGVETQGCMVKEDFEKAFNIKLDIPSSFHSPREGCSCLIGNDIGAYNTCLHGCRYCYANYSTALVKNNYALHDPESTMLIGHLEKDDILKNAKQKSFISSQITLF